MLWNASLSMVPAKAGRLLRCGVGGGGGREAFSDPARREPGVLEKPDRAFTLLGPSTGTAMPSHFPGWEMPTPSNSRMALDNSLFYVAPCPTF